MRAIGVWATGFTGSGVATAGPDDRPLKIDPLDSQPASAMVATTIGTNAMRARKFFRPDDVLAASKFVTMTPP